MLLQTQEDGNNLRVAADVLEHLPRVWCEWLGVRVVSRTWAAKKYLFWQCVYQSVDHHLLIAEFKSI